MESITIPHHRVFRKVYLQNALIQNKQLKHNCDMFLISFIKIISDCKVHLYLLLFYTGRKIKI